MDVGFGHAAPPGDRELLLHTRRPSDRPARGQACSRRRRPAGAAVEGRYRESAEGRGPVRPERLGQIQRAARALLRRMVRSEEHTSELQSLMRISYAVFCSKKKKKKNQLIKATVKYL